MAKVTLVISRSDGADADLLAVALLDNALNLDDEGNAKTQFEPGDQPYFLVHLDPRLVVTDIRCSSGETRRRGRVTREAQAEITIDEAGGTAELEYIPAGEPTFAWYGNSPATTRDGRTLTFSGALPATGSASYTYQAHSYQYLPPPLSPTQEWRTRIVIHVGAA